MALTPEKIAGIGEAFGLGCRIPDAGYPCDMLWFDGDLTPFARAIEAEVRKEYTELIRQMLDALGECKDSTQERIDTLTESGIDKHKPRYFHSYVQDLQRATDAISAARARLEGKP